MSEITSIEISRIRRNGGTQSRAALDQNTVNEYTEALMDGAKMPAIALVFDGTDYWLTDGFHRVAAHEKLAKTHVEAEITQGTQRDAVLASVVANATHGLRRTNADKRRATETLLKDAEWAQWSDREIARRAGVSVPLVGQIRREMAATGVNFNTSRQGADGKTYTVPTKPTTIEEPAKPAAYTEPQFITYDKVLYEGRVGWIAGGKIVGNGWLYQVKFDTPENPTTEEVWVRGTLLTPKNNDTAPAATTAPEELKVGDIVRTRINREGTIKEIIGRTVRLEGDSRIHNIEDLTPLSEIKDFDFRVGDHVLVNGREPIGTISEIKPSQRLVCVTRPNKGGNVTHWMNVNRVQLAPNQTPITAAIEEIKATVTEGQNFELSINSGQLVITPTPEATESTVIVQSPAPPDRAKREYGRGKMTAKKNFDGRWWVGDSANNVIAVVHGYEEIEQELMAHRIANNLNTHIDTDEQTVKTLQAIAAYDNGEQPFSPFLFDDIARIRTWLTTIEHAAKFEQEDIKRSREKSN